MSSLVDHIASVQRRGGFEQQKPAFFIGHWAMLDAARYHDELAFFDPHVTLAKLHAEASFDHQEQFVFVVVMMKDEFSFQFVELKVLSVEFGTDVWLPIFVDLGE